MKKRILTLFCLLTLFVTARAETYHSVKVSKLDFGAGSEEAKKALMINPNSNYDNLAVNVRCVQECYAAATLPADRAGGESNQGEIELVFKLDADATVKGFIDLQTEDTEGNGMKLEGFPFTFTPGLKTATTQDHFDEIRRTRAQWLALKHLPGTAWFRHFSGLSREEENNLNWRGNGLEDSFGIFSGGRAISENLALERDLILAQDKDGKTVLLSEIKGVTVKAIDWSSRDPEVLMQVDALSHSIPGDQHALFAKSLPDLLALVDRMETEILPASQAYSVRNPIRRLASRYTKQMGLDVAPVAARLLPAKSVAVTGGDPFFPMGSDIAILMETDSPELLFKSVAKVIESKASTVGAKETKSPGEGFEYKGFETADRSFSSHICRLGNMVAVSNSSVQIQRLVAVAAQKKDSLGATAEFRFFRSRYPLDVEESAFVFLSDATIRRWAGPELRIAASRRTRAFAALGEMTSQALAGVEISKEYEPLLGETIWQDGRMVSANFGTMDFMKPASELVIESVSTPEKDAYERWRNGYESGWTQVFDPIAIRIVSKKESIGLDLSVIPLTVDSDFAEFVQLCGKAELGDKARWVSPESLFHAALALDTKGEIFHRYNQMAIEFLPGLEVNSLSWMTGSVSVDLEKSLFWEATPDDDFERFMKTPALVRIGSNSRLKLALFMTALRKQMDTSAPDSVLWQTRECDAGSYVAVKAKEDDFGEGASVYYSTLSGALLVSLREDVLIRAMRREKHQLTAGEIESLPAKTQIMLDSTPSFLSGLASLFDSQDTMGRLREESWKALPILNEWHKKFPGKDPVAVQFLHYGEDIHCPGGKGYRWNEAAYTMESVAFGFPSDPKSDPGAMAAIIQFGNVATSLEFEDDGLRAKVSLGSAPVRLSPAREKVEPVLLATADELIPAKEGMILSYKGHANGYPASLKTTIRKVVRAEGKTTYDEESVWIEEDEEPIASKEGYLLDKGLFLKSFSYEDGETLYSKPELNLPEKLVAGAVTRAQASGTCEWEEDGKKSRDEFRSDYELRVIGKEDLDLPAGNFPGCVKIEWAHEELSGGYFTGSKRFAWYHPGTGLVKYEYTEGDDNMMELEKITMPGEGK